MTYTKVENSHNWKLTNFQAGKNGAQMRAIKDHVLILPLLREFYFQRFGTALQISIPDSQNPSGKANKLFHQRLDFFQFNLAHFDWPT